MRRRDMTMCSFVMTLGAAASSDACERDVVSVVHRMATSTPPRNRSRFGAACSLVGE